MNNLVFLTRLKKIAQNINIKNRASYQNLDREECIDFFVLKVKDQNLGFIKTKLLNSQINDKSVNYCGRYNIYAYVIDNNETLKKAGVIHYTVKNNLTNVVDKNGYINRLNVGPQYFRQHIGSTLLKLSEQDLVVGFKFKRVILDRSIFDSKGKLNPNHNFYRVNGYKLDEKRIELMEGKLDCTEPMIKTFDTNEDFINIDSIDSLKKCSIKDNLTKSKLIEKYKMLDDSLINACIFYDKNNNPYLLAEFQQEHSDRLRVDVFDVESKICLEQAAAAEFFINNSKNPGLSNYLSNIEVVEKYKNSGIGSKLLKYVEGRIFASGAKAMRIERDNSRDYTISDDGEIVFAPENLQLYKEYSSDKNRIFQEYENKKFHNMLKNNNVAEIKKPCPITLENPTNKM